MKRNTLGIMSEEYYCSHCGARGQLESRKHIVSLATSYCMACKIFCEAIPITHLDYRDKVKC